MPQCAVVNCNNTHRLTRGGNVRYHRFPGDQSTRTRWLNLCGKAVRNCSTARICSRHFSEKCYERDVQHELLGLPSRFRLKKGAIPDVDLPVSYSNEHKAKQQQQQQNELLLKLKCGNPIDILLAVGLIPTLKNSNSRGGNVPSLDDLHKMRIMEDAKEGDIVVQPSSPGHAEFQQTSTEQVQTDSNSNHDEHQINTEIIIKEENNNPSTFDDNTDQNDSNEETVKDDREIIEEQNDSKRRKPDEENDDTPAKRLRTEIEENFRQRDKILNDFMEMFDCDNSTAEQLQIHSEQLLAEIRTLNDLAREKEHEWNNIVHLKKIKEELLMRIERKRQINNINGDKPESDDENNRNKPTTGQSLLKHNLSRTQKNKSNNFRYILPKNQQNIEINGNWNVKNRPTLDVQSIIADYRQRHPETVPRRGRRIRNAHNGTNGNSNILNFASMAFGSGAQVKHNTNLQDVGNELNILLNAIDNSRVPNVDFSQDSASFKDILVQFAKLSQNERNELIQNAMKPPPPYPEVTVHPVTSTSATPTNSLLHGILTKSPSKVNNKTSFSPTLARLLTAPERGNNNHLTSSITANLSHQYPSNMSISEILSNSKARNEITITPVENQFEQPMRNQKTLGNIEDEETGDSADRLIIDESNEEARKNADNCSENGDEVPQCQGCNQKTAQFVCAGCGNQWYCSRDCQVAAWDEHSEVCAG